MTKNGENELENLNVTLAHKCLPRFAERNTFLIQIHSIDASQSNCMCVRACSIECGAASEITK